MGANPQHISDVLVVMAEEDNNTVTVSSMSGGGVTTWNRAIQYDGVGEPREYDLWYGTVTATGSSTINVTWSGPLSGMTAEYEVQEFGAGLGPGTGWTLDTTDSQENSSSTTVTYPSLTPAASGELYFGFMDMPQTPSGRIDVRLHLRHDRRCQPDRLQPRRGLGGRAAHVLPILRRGELRIGDAPGRPRPAADSHRDCREPLRWPPRRW